MSLCLIIVSLLTIAGKSLPMPSPPPVQLEPQHMANAYGPAIHISSGVLQLAPPDEQTQLLLMPSQQHQVWPHIYLDSLPTSPILPTQESPHISIADNLDFSPSRHLNVNELKLALAQHQLQQLKPHSYGR